jgi:hypothetical protein
VIKGRKVNVKYSENKINNEIIVKILSENYIKQVSQNESKNNNDSNGE